MTAAVLTAVLAGAADAELEDWGPLAEATGYPMATHGLEVWADGDKSGGIWQCEPGPSHWTLETNEVIYVVSGRMTVTPDGGEPTDVGAGDLAVFPLGWTGTWVIHETLRKAYAIF
ncbi:cupin domain-containing protein [Mycobacterium sp. shizuoka-1]|uniref:cupin domain-containing protein n=1 Tax=Mycobacterium sp. shizuoka-1 TaxID=2039281 RepID=UPI000C063341|nr:cupin domain-containing protein [Mycobacterium sp. shizuoka-1]GAY13678.1 hypothetical protein MSZK_04040 [Mycobacterium sp. shizuoka-1]